MPRRPAGSPRNHVVNVYLNRVEYDQLAALADANGHTLGAMARQLMKQGIESMTTPRKDTTGE